MRTLDPDFNMFRPFTRADAVAAGLSPSALRGSNFRRIFRGVYIHVRVPSHPLIRVYAALVIHPPDAIATHTSAARIIGVPVPPTALEHIGVFHEADRRPRPEIRSHLVASDTPVEVVKGVRVPRATCLFLQLAAMLDLVDLVIVGDALVGLGRVTPEELRLVCEKATGNGALLARRAAGYVREGVDSPMETRLRMLIVLAGLPEPEVNHTLYREDGSLRYRLDLSYPRLKLAVEYDGRQHRDDLDQWDADTARRDWFDHNGWMLCSVFSRGIFQRPDETVERVHKALKARGCRSLPRVLAEDWRAHFPVKGEGRKG